MSLDASNDPSSDLRKAARSWVLRLAAGDVDEAALAELKAWRSVPTCNAAFEAERRFYRSLQLLEPAFAAPLAGGEIVRKKLARRKMLRPAVIGGGALALVAIGVALDPLLWLRADTITATGEIARVALPDGSVAMLDSASAIDVDFDGRERRVHLLQGEAWFQVAHDRAHPFIVDANGASAVAVGTAFAVRRQEDGGAVLMVTEGRVRFSGGASQRPIVVTAGQSATVDTLVAGPRGASVPIDEALAWRSGRLIFENRSLSDVAAALGRYRRGRIFVLGNAAERRVSGVLEVGAIDKGLDGLAAAQDLKITRVTPWIVILR